MCRWLAYLGAKCSIEKLVYEGERSLCAQAMHSSKAKLGVHGDGGGLAWFGDLAEPGLYRNPGPAWGDPNLKELARQIKSGLFFAHVRASTGASNMHVNCHPFRSGPWLFMHNGQIGGYDKLRRRMESLLNDECYLAIEGGTDSEMLFQLMIHCGLKENPRAGIRNAIEAIEDIRISAGIKEAFRATFALATDDRVWAIRWSSDSYAPSLYRNCDEDNVLLVSEPLDEDLSSWAEVPPNSLVELTKHPSGRISVGIEQLFLDSPMKENSQAIEAA
jgi:glutamine amidotransferase